MQENIELAEENKLTLKNLILECPLICENALIKCCFLGSYELKSLPDAIKMVKDSLDILNGFEQDIRESFTVPKALNGTQGYVSTKCFKIKAIKLQIC